MRKTGKEIRGAMVAEKEKKEYGAFEKYEVEGWADTLQRAAEIMGDAKKMKAVAKCLEKKTAATEMLKSWTKGKEPQSDQDEA